MISSLEMFENHLFQLEEGKELGRSLQKAEENSKIYGETWLFRHDNVLEKFLHTIHSMFSIGEFTRW